MNVEQKHYGKTQYNSVLSAWREQIKATKRLEVKQQLMNGEHELLPRFAEQYAKLQALPRRARRAMQRQWKRSLAGMALLLALAAGVKSGADAGGHDQRARLIVACPQLPTR